MSIIDATKLNLYRKLKKNSIFKNRFNSRGYIFRHRISYPFFSVNEYFAKLHWFKDDNQYFIIYIFFYLVSWLGTYDQCQKKNNLF